MNKAAARLNPGEKIKHRKKWVEIRSVIIGAKTTTLALVSDAILVYQHSQQIPYQVREINRHGQAVYASRATADNASDSSHGIDSIRSK